MSEPKNPKTEEVEVNIGEVDVSVVSTKSKKDLFLPISILVAAVLIGGSVVFF
jgi:hypothetical protein